MSYFPVNKLKNIAGTVINPATEGKQDNIITGINVLNSLAPSVYDYISFAYTGSNITTIVFMTGGSGGTTVSTLTLAYDTNDNLTSITKI